VEDNLATKKASRKPRSERPSIADYGIPESRKGLLPWAWAEQRLKKSHNYWVITSYPDGRPHAMPVWGVWVDGAFYFSTGRGTRKAYNLAQNPNCVVCNERAQEAVIVHGIAQEVTNAERIRELSKPYYRKYKPWKLDPAMGAIYEVRPTLALGMYEKKFAAAATRWKFA
jgi:nitroimidazol reductase NimA-like FMN-containing flavoprotein (pyridoxamine 5'-phosphate oxidase superfamily)